jgi:hypothetical protein
MLPSLRLLIAAMLATIVVLIGGFGMFAALRVSRDPIAHLPTAAAPLQQVADAGTVSLADGGARETEEERSQFDVAADAPQRTVPGTSTAGQSADAVFAGDDPPAARAIEARASSADRDAEDASVASAPSPQPASASGPVPQGASLSESGGRHGDIVPDAAAGFSLPRPPEPAAGFSTAATDPAIEAATPSAPAGDVTDSQPTFAQASATDTLAALDLAAEPAADHRLAIEPMPPGTAERSGPEPRLKPPRRTAAIARPKRARVFVGRPVRAVRFATPYYGQYAQSTEQSYTYSYGYGYGYGDSQAADQQPAAPRYLVRPRVARTVNSAVGGPFVKAPTQ